MFLPQSIQSEVQLPERTLMLLDPRFDLLDFYTQAFWASGWRVVGTMSSPSAFLSKYLSLNVKPQLLLIELQQSPEDVVAILEQILQHNPCQEIVFVTGETCVLTVQQLLPSHLHQFPIILKSTHTFEELIVELDELLLLSLVDYEQKWTEICPSS